MSYRPTHAENAQNFNNAKKTHRNQLFEHDTKYLLIQILESLRISRSPVSAPGRSPELVLPRRERELERQKQTSGTAKQTITKILSPDRPEKKQQRATHSNVDKFLKRAPVETKQSQQTRTRTCSEKFQTKTRPEVEKSAAQLGLSKITTHMSRRIQRKRARDAG